MAILTRDQLIAAASGAQATILRKSASRAAVANVWYSVFDQTGTPGAGALAGTSVAAGVVPTDATQGCPAINAFGVSATGYITALDYGNTVASRISLYDMLWKGGAYPFNAAQTLAAQPSFSSRVPGLDYKGCELWLECVTPFTGLQTIQIAYLDDTGASGDTGAIATGVAPLAGRLYQMPLAAGDFGVQRVNSVTSTVATVGTFNVLVMRRLGTFRCRVANDGDTHGPDKLGMPVVYTDSALYMMVAADSTTTGAPDLFIDIANG